MGYENCPCKGCKRRYKLCHSSCEEYKEWKEEIEEIKQKKAKDKELENALWGISERGIKNTNHGKWKPKERTKK